MRKKLEDFYDDTERYIDKIERAWAKAALYFRTERHFGHKDTSIRCQGLLTIHERLEVYRRRFESGKDTLSLLHAVSICAEENLPLPTWLAVKYQEAFSSFLSLTGPTSLDAIFYSPNLPTNTAKKTAEARQNWELGTDIYREVWNEVMFSDAATSLDGALEIVLKKYSFGVKKTKAKALFLMIEQNQLELMGGRQSVSQFLEKRRKP